MRILYCSITYPPHISGQSIFTQSMAEGMAKRGHEVMVLIPEEDGYLPRYDRNGIRFMRVPALNLAVIHPNLRMPFFNLFGIRRLFEEFQPQIVHIQDPSPLSQVALFEARRWNIPVIITHHSGPEINAPYLCINNPFLKRVTNGLSWKIILTYLKRGDLVTVPSRYSARMLEENGLKKRVKTVPCGVNLVDFHSTPDRCQATIREQYGLDHNKILFLYLGRVDPEKNIDVMIRAMGILKRSDTQFAIAGHGFQENNLKQMVRELGLEDQVRFIGQVDHANLPNLVHSADIFVMPGIAESFSIATLEAMACSKPVLAANAAALPELVTHYVNGYLFQPLDPEDAARGIEMLIKYRKAWPAMGGVSLRKAMNYDVDTVLQSYEQIYTTSLLKDRNSDVHKIRGIGTHMGRPVYWQLMRMSPRFLLMLLITLIFMFSNIFYDQAQANSFIRLSDLAPLVLESSTHMMVISPHPDDELLAAGGLIQRVLETGGQVIVVLVTNGDGQYISPLVINNQVVPKPIDYIGAGQHRQLETLTALKELGISSDHVIFLGYPDGRINNLWKGNWQGSIPIRAPFTNSSKSPYENTFNKDAIYQGADLYNDLKKVIEIYQPDILLIPHPEDTNLDHSAVSNFAQFAIAGYLSSGREKQPAVLAYLVHYGAYPVPRNEKNEKVILPPAPLSNKGKGWITFSLSNSERVNKMDGLLTYVSQKRIMPNYMKNFAQANEIFFDLPIIELPVIGFDDREVLEQNKAIDHAIAEPSRERLSRLVFSDADLLSWKVSRLGSILCFAVETQGRIGKNLDYRVLAKLPDGETLQVTKNDDLFTIGDRHFGTCFNLEDLGNPSTVGFLAETWAASVLIDRTAWHFVYFPSD